MYTEIITYYVKIYTPALDDATEAFKGHRSYVEIFLRPSSSSSSRVRVRVRVRVLEFEF